MQLVRQDYVDEKKTGYDELTHAALKGMLRRSTRTRSSWSRGISRGCRTTRTRASADSGLVVALRDGMLTIVSPMEDTPGSRAGLLPGDQI